MGVDICLPFKYTRMVKVINSYACVHKRFCLYYSTTIHRNQIIIGMLVAPDSDSLSLVLRHCRSISFSVGNVLVSRFIPIQKYSRKLNLKHS